MAALQKNGHGVFLRYSNADVYATVCSALLFARGSKGDLNVKGAILHMAAEAAVSAAPSMMR
jgi:cobalt-zinc-cadmium efflux system protein